MAAYGCISALSTVLDSVSAMPVLFPELEAILFPLMQRLTSTDGQDVFEEVLELISYFTYFSPGVRQKTSQLSKSPRFPSGYLVACLQSEQFSLTSLACSSCTQPLM